MSELIKKNGIWLIRRSILFTSSLLIKQLFFSCDGKMIKLCLDQCKSVVVSNDMSTLSLELIQELTKMINDTDMIFTRQGKRSSKLSSFVNENRL